MKTLLFTLLFILSANSYAGCGITWTAKNNGDVGITLLRSFSKVKVKGGWYKKFMYDASHSLNPGDTVTEGEILDLGCNKKRRFKIEVWCAGASTDTKTVHFPSSTTYYSKGKTYFNFGDLSDYCE